MTERGERSPSGTVAVAMAAAVVLVAGGGVGGALGGERAALAGGEVWRLWTAHLVHFSARHALWSGMVWLAAGAWMEREDRRAWTWVVLAGAPLVTAAALTGDAEMARYGGLSGLACAPLGWAAWRLWRDGERARRAAGAAIFALLAAKIGAEAPGGRTMLASFAAEAGEVRPAVWAHAAGVLIGVMVARRRARRGAVMNSALIARDGSGPAAEPADPGAGRARALGLRRAGAAGGVTRMSDATKTTVRVETKGAYAVAYVTGRLDAAGTTAAQAAVANALEAAPGARLAIDLSGVPYVASVGLRLLMATARALEKRGGRLVVANPTDEAAMVLAVAGLEKPMRVCAGDAAVAKAFG